MASSSTPLTPDRLPDWLAEALDVLTARRRLVVGVAVGLVLLGAVVALVAPSILPGRPVVGVAVGIASALLATALALALDASDLVVRGARHVRAAGGDVDVRLGRGHEDVGPLLASVARHAGRDGAIRVALTPASRTAAVPGPRATALAEAIARTGRSVLVTDLTRSGSPAAGLSDVVAGEKSLSEVVRFEQEIKLARLAVGPDPDLAVRRFSSFVEVLPSDLEVLVVALPPLAEPGVLRSVEAFDLTLVLVEVDRTERVDLIASLDAMDAAHATSELVLIDPSTHKAGGDTTTTPIATDEEHDDHDEDEGIGSVRRGAFAAPDPFPGDDGPSQPPAAEYSFGGVQDVEAIREQDVADGPEPEAADEPVVDVADEPAMGADPVSEDADDITPAADEDDGGDDATTDAHPGGEDVTPPTSPAEDDTTEDDTTEIPAVPVEDRPAPDADQQVAIWGSHRGAPDVEDLGVGSPVVEEPEHGRAPATGSSAVRVVERPRAAEPADSPAPVSAASWAWSSQGSLPADELEEDVAFEVARTSAALQQLAQQVWQRQAR